MRGSKALAGVILLVITLSQRVPTITGEVDFQTAYRIILHEDSSATWIIELSTILSQDDLDDFEEFKNNADTNTLLSSFKSTINNIVNSAASLTGRPMKSENFTLKIYVSGILRQRGMIEYCFTWVNFSIKTPSTIEVGDVFEGGFYLFPNETLEISYSELLSDYFLKLVSPRPSNQDVSRVIWIGRLDFPDGEPRLVFQNRTILVQGFSLNNSSVKKGSQVKVYGYVNPIMPGLRIQLIYVNPEGLEIVREVIVEGNGSFSDNYFVNMAGGWSVSLRLPSGSQYVFKQAPQPLQFLVYDENGEEPSSSPIPPPIMVIILLACVLVGSSVLLLLYRSLRKALPSPAEKYILSDEDLVMRILKNSGGRLAQTQIKEATGFSKSKTSMVLNNLQKKGLIRKIKRGREFIVELV